MTRPQTTDVNVSRNFPCKSREEGRRALPTVENQNKAGNLHTTLMVIGRTFAQRVLPRVSSVSIRGWCSQAEISPAPFVKQDLDYPE